MVYLAVTLTALVAAGLTFFAGFGLGTLLLPVLALYYPLEIAVAATAVVHMANSIFKAAIVIRHVQWRTVWRFGAPAAVSAMAGAWVLGIISTLNPIVSYNLGGRECEVTIVKLVIGALIVVFAMLEGSPRLERWTFPTKWIPLGGALSGFIGGVSGHQGALRSAFLIRAGLTREQFIATGAATAVIVDLARLTIYGATFIAEGWDPFRAGGEVGVIAAACAAAFIGSVIGARLLRRVTMHLIRRIVAAMLLALGSALAAGLL